MAYPLILGGVAAATALATLIESLTKKKGETGFFSGSQGGQISTLTPEQQKSQNLLLQNIPQLLQQLQGPLQPSPGFENIANREMAKFKTQTVPSLAERFTAMGAPLSSGGYREALERATSGLHENLAALGYQAAANERSQNLDLLMTLLRGGMSPSTQYLASQPGFAENAARAALGIGGQLGAGYLASGRNLSDLWSSGKTQQPYNLMAQQSNPWEQQMASLKTASPRDFFLSSGITRG